MGGTGRTAAPVAENHQERCNPAIRAAALMFIINRLKMAKDMHRSKVTKYEAPTYDTLSLDRIEPVCRNGPAAGAGAAERRMAPL
jgi:hypothetical protein